MTSTTITAADYAAVESAIAAYYAEHGENNGYWPVVRLYTEGPEIIARYGGDDLHPNQIMMAGTEETEELTGRSNEWILDQN